MALLSREQILQVADLPRELVPVPEWGGEVHVRCLTGAERDAWEAGGLVDPGRSEAVRLDNLRARLCALAVCDADGNRLFGDDDVRALGAKSAAALDRCYRVAARLSRLGRDDAEGLEKNSAPAPGSASGSS